MDAQSALELFSKELLSYDSHVGGNDMFYYNLPYERNYALTNTIPLAPVSGNVIKFYQYRLEKPVIIYTDVIDTTPAQPAVTEDKEYEGEEASSLEDALYDENGELRDLSEEEMAALLTADRGDDTTAPSEEFDDEAYDKAPATEAESYDDYEDYDDEEIYDKAPSVVQSDGTEEEWEAPEF